jgi:hypothetical protein
MPNATLPISDLHWTVDRPVILGIVRDILEITQISNKTPVNFFGIDAKNFQQGSTLQSSGLGENRWPYDERVMIEIDEDYQRDTIVSTPVQREEYQPFFLDAALGVSIRPVYSMSKVSVNFKYRAADKNQANMWRNMMRVRTSMMRDINLHEVGYSYRIPDAFLGIVEEIHTLREKVAGYDEDLNDYYTARLLPNVGIVSNLSGDEGVWAVSERQIRIQGYCDFEGAPDKGDREDDHDNWAVGFTYVFTYMKPVACNMRYPIMVHNQMIGEDYLPPVPAYRLENQRTRYSLSGYAYSYFETDRRMLSAMGETGLVIPSFDDFVPNLVLPTTVAVFTALINITADDRCSLLNLKELGEYQLNSDVLNFMLGSERIFLNKDFQSILMLSLYQGSDLMKSETLSVDTLGNVRAAMDLDLRKTYHVRLSLVTDPGYLPMRALTRLQNNPSTSVQIVNAISAALDGIQGARDDVGRTQLSDSDIELLCGKTLAANYQRGADIHFISSLYAKTEGLPL